MAFKQASLVLFSINAKGLNIPEKRSTALTDFRKHKASIVFVQETHFRIGSRPRFTDSNFPTGLFSDTPGSKSRGTAILFHKSVPYQEKATLTDENGRYVFTKGQIAGLLFTFANVYVPNKAQHRFLAKTLRTLHTFSEGTLILRGDFNVPLHPSVDTSTGRSSMPSHVLRSISHTLHSSRLVDCWRGLHPTDRDFSFYAHTTASYSRIDYIFLPFFHLHLLLSETIGNITWSDHAPVIATFLCPTFRPTAPNWRLNDAHLADPTLSADSRLVLERYFEENVDPEIPPATVWEAHKCVMRGHFVSVGSAIIKRREAEIQDLLSKIDTTELQHKRTGEAALLSSLTELRRSLADIMNTKHHRDLRRSQAYFHVNGNKCGRLLARQLAKRRTATYIPSIRNKKGDLQHLPQHILQSITDYYKSLYAVPGSPSEAARSQLRLDIDRYLNRFLTRKVTPSAAELLDEPLTDEELRLAIKSTQSGKCPGPDGFPTHYYKHFADILSPHFLRAFNSLSDTRLLPPQSLMANIVLIPKEGKDKEHCASYRPISLLNCDVKLFAKILATRLNAHIPSLIHLDQVGFVPHREARDNTIRALHLIHAAPRVPGGLLLLSTDAEKAFDRAGWDFIFATLRHLGLGPSLCSWIQALYTGPSARVCVNGIFTDSFPICNVTRQGYPLSPLLFVLSLEPFLEAVRQHPDISGVSLGRDPHKVAAYADDLLFFISNPLISLPNILTAFEEYYTLANLKINFTKSSILNISVPSHRVIAMRPTLPFVW
uniref:Reverse transcriptase domain-containing protein n=1 Tax=Leptobrachium leishanense TaxID=445787 RepID=A0A8C5PI59_9ANUR